MDSRNSGKSMYHFFLDALLLCHCGWLALMAGLSTGADFVFLPEKPPAEGWETEMCDIIAKVSFFGIVDAEIR